MTIPHEELLCTIVGYAVLGCELLAVLVVAVDAVHTLNSYAWRIFGFTLTDQNLGNDSRLVWHKLSLSLEFAMAADVLKLAISLTFSDISALFATILLNYFLKYDIKATQEYNIVPELNQIADPEGESQAK
ncbi:MAG: DUF1622 domain-containing protein [Anaerolineaceae bacterium]